MARLGHGRKQVPTKMKSQPRWKAEGTYVFPSQEKYPIGTLFHARKALGGIYASSGYTTPANRKKILTAVAKKWPAYDWAEYWDDHIMGNKPARKRSTDGGKLYPLYDWDRSIGAAPARRRKAANPRRNTMARRRNYGRNVGHFRLLENPYGLKLGKGKAIRVGKGDRTHILNSQSGFALCGAGAPNRAHGASPIRASDAAVITCYRCIKLTIINLGEDVGRELRYGKRPLHMQIGGGREGNLVSGADPSEYGPLGLPDYASLIGSEEYPTQSTKVSRATRARRESARRARIAKAGRKRVGRANPHGGRHTPGQAQSLYERGFQAAMQDPRRSPAQLSRASFPFQSGFVDGLAAVTDRRSTRKRAAPKRRRRSTKRRRR